MTPLFRWALAVAFVVTVASDAGRGEARQPPAFTQRSVEPLPDREAVLRSVAAYLAQYEQDVSALVAEEDYFQQFLSPSVPGVMSGGRAVFTPSTSRALKSDLLVLTDSSYGWVTFRDVFEVDGRPVRDRDQRLAALFESPDVDARQKAQAIALEGARFNLDVRGVSTNRTLNVPMAALLFWRGQSQSRSRFSLERVETMEGRRAAVLGFEEQALPRLVRSSTDAPMRGTAWIEVSSGRVLRTDLAVTLGTTEENTEVQIKVVYAEEPKSKLWVPLSMDESYAAIRFGQPAGIISARAKYSKFRQFRVDAMPQRK